MDILFLNEHLATFVSPIDAVNENIALGTNFSKLVYDFVVNFVSLHVADIVFEKISHHVDAVIVCADGSENLPSWRVAS